MDVTLSCKDDNFCEINYRYLVDDMEDDKFITMLSTKATTIGGMDDVANTIMRVKAGESIKESKKNLASVSVLALGRTYAYLMNINKDEEDVTKLKKEELEIMIMYRLKQLMPTGCIKCNKLHHTTRTEVPEVTCRMCGTGACKDCFTTVERNNKWTHLCKVCTGKPRHWPKSVCCSLDSAAEELA